MSGAIVLAAYDPTPELFRRQLRSIQAQTVSDWTCVISVDGAADVVRHCIEEAVGGDTRFVVVSDGRRRGFYLNFENGLRSIPSGVDWVALSDQDDYWYPEKIERLLPHLDDVDLVAGQARLVRYPDETEQGVTDRQDLGAELTMLVNQFTGSLSLFRAGLLETALPFPRLSSRTVAHDHWLAMVAYARRGARVVDTVVQDYVQHGANVFGDPSALRAGPVHTVRRAVSNVVGFSRRFEGSASPRAMARMLFWVYVGWRQLMAEELVARTQGEREARSDLVAALRARFGRERTLKGTREILRRARGKAAVPPAFAVAYLGSWAAGLLVRGRSLRPTAIRE